MVCFTIKDQKDLDYFINYKVLNKNRIDFKYFIKILKEKEILMYNKNIKFY